MKVGEIWIYKENMLKFAINIFNEKIPREDTKVKITRLFEKKEKEKVAFIYVFQHEKENPQEANLAESELDREEFVYRYERAYNE